MGALRFAQIRLVYHLPELVLYPHNYILLLLWKTWVYLFCYSGLYLLSSDPGIYGRIFHNPAGRYKGFSIYTYRRGPNPHFIVAQAIE
jgi:hypothetical protein